MFSRISNLVKRRQGSEDGTMATAVDQGGITTSKLADKRGTSTDTEDVPIDPRRGLSASIKRKSLRRRQSKREKPEEKTYGNSPEVYEEIRMRVLQEKAVVNAIEALQERWQMIMFMYHDCVDLNKGRISRQQLKLDVKRKEELIIVIALFCLICLPVAGAMVLVILALR